MCTVHAQAIIYTIKMLRKVKVPIIVLYYILKSVACKVNTEREFAACNSCSSYCSVEGSWQSVTELLEKTYWETLSHQGHTKIRSELNEVFRCENVQKISS